MPRESMLKCDNRRANGCQTHLLFLLEQGEKLRMQSQHNLHRIYIQKDFLKNR